MRTDKKPVLPLVRLSLVRPFLEELKRRKIDPDEVLVDLSVTGVDLQDPEVFIPAPRMYSIVEVLSELSGDPCFGIHVGSQLDPLSWSPLARATENSSTVGEFLLRFMKNASKDESSVTYRLDTIGNRSTFFERRFTDGGIVPRHNDGFTVAYLVTLIRRAVGEKWDGNRVIASVCDPSVIPDSYFGMKCVAADALGASISFPAEWLIQPLPGKNLNRISESDSTVSSPSRKFINALHMTLEPHIHELDLNADRVAGICGINKRTLARRLQSRGTNLRGELNRLRMSRAEKTLSGTNLRISEVALMAGYSNPTVFSRAFKRWSGLSPRLYRTKANNSDGHSLEGAVRS